MPANDQNQDKPKGKWPSGTTFVMYCGGLSLLVLTVYVTISGKDFNFTAKEVSLSTIKTGLAPQGIATEAVQQQSAQLKEKFDKASSEVASAKTADAAQNPDAPDVPVSAPFNGTYEGSGSTYVLEQSGMKVVLAEMTNGTVTAYGEGIASGNTATLTVQTALMPLSVQLVIENERQIKLIGPQTYMIERK